MASECSEENAPVHEAGTIEWPNGADVAPESLYDRVKEHSETSAR